MCPLPHSSSSERSPITWLRPAEALTDLRSHTRALTDTAHKPNHQPPKMANKKNRKRNNRNRQGSAAGQAKPTDAPPAATATGEY